MGSPCPGGYGAPGVVGLTGPARHSWELDLLKAQFSTLCYTRPEKLLSN